MLYLCASACAGGSSCNRRVIGAKNNPLNVKVIDTGVILVQVLAQGGTGVVGARNNPLMLQSCQEAQDRKECSVIQIQAAYRGRGRVAAGRKRYGSCICLCCDAVCLYRCTRALPALHTCTCEHEGCTKKQDTVSV